MEKELTSQQIDKLINVYRKHKHSIFLNSKKPSFLAEVNDFIQGAMSYPEGWWAANYQLIALTGALGQHEKGNAKLRQAILNNILAKALSDSRITLHIIKEVINYKLEYHSMQIAGRIAGGFVTNRILLSPLNAILKNTFNKKTYETLSISVAALQFIYVSFGTAILAIAKGYRTISPIISSIVTGDINNIGFYPDITHIPDYSSEQLKQFHIQYKLGLDLVISVNEINRNS